MKRAILLSILSLWLSTVSFSEDSISRSSSGVSSDVNCPACIDVADLAPDSVTEPKLKAVDTANDEDILTYEITTGDFEWLTPHAGTDLLTDLEEETHASEHQENGADEMLVEDMGTACTDGQVFKANATGGAACGGINTTNIQFSGASVTHNANQTVGDTILAFNTERYDTGSYHDNATNNSRLTVSTTGYYRATCRAAIENTTTTAIFVAVRKNGSTILCTNSEEAHAATNVHRHIGCAVSAKLNATDYVECRAFISGGGKNVLTLSDESPTFSIEFLGVD